MVVYDGGSDRVERTDHNESSEEPIVDVLLDLDFQTAVVVYVAKQAEEESRHFLGAFGEAVDTVTVGDPTEKDGSILSRRRVDANELEHYLK